MISILLLIPWKYVKLISRVLDEAKECIEKKYAIQASEKLYKASEESLELLSAKFRLPEYEDAKKEEG